MKPTTAEIAETIKRLAAHYPEAGHNGATIAILAEDWADDLGIYAVSQQTFHAAVKVCRRECRFFPKISEILAAAKTVDAFKASHPVPGQLQLKAGGELTAEECARNKKRIAALMSGMERGASEDELLAEIAGIG